MNTVIVLVLAFSIGVVLSIASATLVAVVFRRVAAEPITETPTERVFKTLLRLAPRESPTPTLSRILAFVSASTAPVSLTFAAVVAALIPHAEIRPALHAIRQYANHEQVSKTTATDLVNPPDIHTALIFVQRDLDWYDAVSSQYSLFSEALLTSSAEYFGELMKGSRLTFPGSHDAPVVRFRGYQGELRTEDLTEIYEALRRSLSRTEPVGDSSRELQSVANELYKAWHEFSLRAGKSEGG